MPSDHDRGGRSCAGCDFYKPIETFQMPDWGMCRRRAPVVIAERSRNEHGNITSEPRSVFPMVQTSDWCGEWERAT